MSPQIKRILEELVKENGRVTYDSEWMVCRGCKANEALGSLSIIHELDCIVELAKTELKNQ
jgi:hypothetical protein